MAKSPRSDPSGALGSEICRNLRRAGAERRHLECLATDGWAATQVARLLRGEGMFLPLGAPGPVSLAAPEPEPSGPAPAAEPEITVLEPAIDCSAGPHVPKGLRVEPSDQIVSRFRGRLARIPEAVGLHLDDGQKGSGVIEGFKLKKRLEGQQVLPANILDWLLENPKEIPDAWKGKRVYFWGTVYRVRHGDPMVRYLHWFALRWGWYYCWIGSDWNGSEPTAVAADVF